MPKQIKQLAQCIGIRVKREVRKTLNSRRSFMNADYCLY